MHRSSYGGFLTSKTDPFFSFSAIIPAPSTQTRFHPLPRISFPIHSPSLHVLTSRVCSRPGWGSGSFSPKAMFEGSLSVPNSGSFYELLGIPETGTLLEIKQAYKQLARKYHPDVSPPDRVEEYTLRFIQVQEAYETLSDPNRRALYDRDLAKGLHLAFGVRRRYQNYDEQTVEKSEWKSHWQSQLSGLKRRSMHKDGSMSWGARMRRQRNESSS